jgi:hypothetical protein
MSQKKGGEQGGLKKRLEDLLKQPDNQVCADCPERGEGLVPGTRWIDPWIARGPKGALV